MFHLFDLKLWYRISVWILYVKLTFQGHFLIKMGESVVHWWLLYQFGHKETNRALLSVAKIQLKFDYETIIFDTRAAVDLMAKAYSSTLIKFGWCVCVSLNILAVICVNNLGEHNLVRRFSSQIIQMSLIACPGVWSRPAQHASSRWLSFNKIPVSLFKLVQTRKLWFICFQLYRNEIAVTLF